MPFTPYHFGASGFGGLLFRRWLDVPVFVAANILIDIEVLADNRFAPGWPVHQLWHFHTLFVGGAAGAIFGLLVYYLKPLRLLSQKSMSLIGLPSGPSWHSMMLAGLFGAMLHVCIDSFYHYDVQIFWPFEMKNPIFGWLTAGLHLKTPYIQQQVRLGCIIFWIIAAAFYILLLLKQKKNPKPL